MPGAGSNAKGSDGDVGSAAAAEVQAQRQPKYFFVFRLEPKAGEANGDTGAADGAVEERYVAKLCCMSDQGLMFYDPPKVSQWAPGGVSPVVWEELATVVLVAGRVGDEFRWSYWKRTDGRGLPAAATATATTAVAIATPTAITAMPRLAQNYNMLKILVGRRKNESLEEIQARIGTLGFTASKVRAYHHEPTQYLSRSRGSSNRQPQSRQGQPHRQRMHASDISNSFRYLTSAPMLLTTGCICVRAELHL